ncbi:ribbon-helix-helix domain-containing protein [Ramlibacter sp. 2FC]|uniref:ribbon-helix-helix domain-containing protein n=1 Tax=Ramlibacter sp. 2FC TaxID=2502188 RepID=UPI0010F742EE|nr:ribbon-helix-helix domain-containing protein [Ramlibacter sp. 2FC]
MNTLTVKIPPSLVAALEQVSEQEHLSKSELVRRALAAYIRQRNQPHTFVSALEQAGDLVGCFSGGPADLSSNPRHLDGFGSV